VTGERRGGDVTEGHERRASGTSGNRRIRSGAGLARPGVVLIAVISLTVLACGDDGESGGSVQTTLSTETTLSGGTTTVPAASTGNERPTEIEVVAAYPDEVTLYPSITEEPEAYPFGIPPPIRLSFGPATPLSEEEVAELAVVTSGVTRPVTLTILTGPHEGMTFEFGEVVVPTGWRLEDLEAGEIVSYRELTVESEETDFIPVETPVADIRSVDDMVFAGFLAMGPGTFRLGFPFQGDGNGGMRGVGVELRWRGPMECVLVPIDPIEGFDPAENCSDKTGDMFWDWGVNTVYFG